jgi:hypothetical protein
MVEYLYAGIVTLGIPVMYSSKLSLCAQLPLPLGKAEASTLLGSRKRFLKDISP